MPRAVLGLAVVATLLGAIDVRAQSSFEAASVKPSDQRARSAVVPGMPLPGGRWSAHRATLALILRSTYDLPLDRFVGLPDWALTERFDIVARAKTNVPAHELRSMAKRLLAERFGLRVRIGHRDASVYAITRINDEGGLKAGLLPSSCNANQSMPSGTPSATGKPNPCGTELISRLEGGGLRLQLRGRQLMDLVTLSGARADFDAPLVDRTELVGTFDIDFSFQPPDVVQPGGLSTAPSFTTALSEQLGLKVQRRTEIVEILIIEALERPALD